MPQLRGKQTLPSAGCTAQARAAGPCAGILFGSVCVFSVGWGDGGWGSAGGFSLGRVVEALWAGLQRGNWISALRPSLPWHVHWGMKNSGSQFCCALKWGFRSPVLPNILASVKHCIWCQKLGLDNLEMLRNLFPQQLLRSRVGNIYWSGYLWSCLSAGRWTFDSHLRCPPVLCLWPSNLGSLMFRDLSCGISRWCPIQTYLWVYRLKGGEDALCQDELRHKGWAQ